MQGLVFVGLLAFALKSSLAAESTTSTIDFGQLEGGAVMRAVVKIVDSGTTLDPTTIEMSFSADVPEKREIQISSVVLTPIGAIQALYDTDPASKSYECRKSHTFKLGSIHPPVTMVCFFQPLVTLRTAIAATQISPGQQPFTLSVVMPGSTTAVEKTVLVVQRYAQVSIAIAGALGGFLYALLTGLVRPRVRAETRFPAGGTRTEHLRWIRDVLALGARIDSLRRVLHRTVLGGVVASIVLAVSKTSGSAIGAPISVNVDSVWGGILVGLASLPIANFLLEKFSSSGNTSKEVASAKQPGALG